MNDTLQACFVEGRHKGIGTWAVNHVKTNYKAKLEFMTLQMYLLEYEL